MPKSPFASAAGFERFYGRPDLRYLAIVNGASQPPILRYTAMYAVAGGSSVSFLGASGWVSRSTAR
jgi:hypothetical protein